jgi:transcriptional regulator with XRE-family HTH domain
MKCRRIVSVSYVAVMKKVTESELPTVVFGEAIQTLRKQKGLKQFQLANLVNKSRHMITNIEMGRKCIYLEDIFDFSKALKVSPEKLFDMVCRRRQHLLMGTKTDHKVTARMGRTRGRGA